MKMVEILYFSKQRKTYKRKWEKLSEKQKEKWRNYLRKQKH